MGAETMENRETGRYCEDQLMTKETWIPKPLPFTETKYIIRNGKWIASQQHTYECVRVLEENNEVDEFFKMENEDE